MPDLQPELPFDVDYVIREQGDLDRMFQSIAEDVRAAEWEPWLENEFRELEKAHGELFEHGGSGFFSSGGWAPNAQSTVKKKGHARPLFGVPKEGFRLHKSLTQPDSEFGIRIPVDNWPDRATLVFGTDAPYHIYNQEGTSRIPARPHVGMSIEYFDKVVTRAVDHVFQTIQE